MYDPATYFRYSQVLLPVYSQVRAEDPESQVKVRSRRCVSSGRVTPPGVCGQVMTSFPRVPLTVFTTVMPGNEAWGAALT